MHTCTGLSNVLGATEALLISHVLTYFGSQRPHRERSSVWLYFICGMGLITYSPILVEHSFHHLFLLKPCSSAIFLFSIPDHVCTGVF